MNKKVYQQPALRIMEVHTGCPLAVNSVDSNAGVKMGQQGSDNAARGRQSSDWLDEE
jgi:hypothetical protein